MGLLKSKSRKGNISSIPLILFLTFSLTISVFVSFLVLTEFDSAMQGTPFYDDTEQHTNNAATALGVFEVGIIMVNVAFYLVSAALVYRIPTNPVFALPGFLLLGISIWFSAEISNMYHLFIGTGPLQSVAASFPLTTQFYGNLPLITGGLGTLVLVLLYGKTRQGVETTV